MFTKYLRRQVHPMLELGRDYCFSLNPTAAVVQTIFSDHFHVNRMENDKQIPCCMKENKNQFPDGLDLLVECQKLFLDRHIDFGVRLVC